MWRHIDVQATEEEVGPTVGLLTRIDGDCAQERMTYCKVFYFREYQFSSIYEKRLFRQYVNSSFQDSQNIICHKDTYPKNSY